MNHGSFRSKRTTDTPYGSLRGTHKLVAGGVWVSRGGSLWQHVSIYGLCQAWWAVLCWECWQIPWMFSGFCVCKTWIKDTDSELNEVLTIFLYRGLSCWTKSSRLCSLNCTSTKTSSVVSAGMAGRLTRPYLAALHSCYTYQPVVLFRLCYQY